MPRQKSSPVSKKQALKTGKKEEHRNLAVNWELTLRSDADSQGLAYLKTNSFTFIDRITVVELGYRDADLWMVRFFDSNGNMCRYYAKEVLDGNDFLELYKRYIEPVSVSFMNDLAKEK